MKNIILLGAPRCGKTTLSKMLSSQYQIISGDALRVAYHKTVLKNSNMSSDEVGESKEFRKFLEETFNRHLLYNPDTNYILDTVDFDLCSCSKFDKYDVMVIVLGHINESAENIVKLQQLYDKEGKDWSYKMDDQSRLQHVKKSIQKSRRLKSECEIYGYKFVDTSSNRCETLNKLYEFIIQS